MSTANAGYSVYAIFYTVADMRNCNNQLFLGPMPGIQEPLSDWLNAMCSNKITHVICMTSSQEIQDKSPDYARYRNSGNFSPSVQFTDVPVQDGAAPDVEQLPLFWATARKAVQLIENHEPVFIHCRGGRGRTGLMAAAVLMMQGMDMDEALKAVASAGSQPEAEQQLAVLSNGPTA